CVEEPQCQVPRRMAQAAPAISRRREPALKCQQQCEAAGGHQRRNMMNITLIVHRESSPRFDIACEVEPLPHPSTSHQATSLDALESLSCAHQLSCRTFLLFSTFPPKDSPPIAGLRAWMERNLASLSLRGDYFLASVLKT